MIIFQPASSSSGLPEAKAYPNSSRHQAQHTLDKTPFHAGPLTPTHTNSDLDNLGSHLHISGMWEEMEHLEKTRTHGEKV